MDKTLTSNAAISGSPIPSSWLYCFNANCPRKDDCVRYRSTCAIQKGQTTGYTVYPTALRQDATCPHFKQLQMIHTAWGFGTMFDEVKAKDAPLLRSLIKHYLGGNGSYYNYHHGRRHLSPEQQEWIKQLFKRFGYTDAEFDFSQEEIDLQ